MFISKEFVITTIKHLVQPYKNIYMSVVRAEKYIYYILAWENGHNLLSETNHC